MSKPKRVIFSNVPPCIPHCPLEEIIDCLNIKRFAPIATLRATIVKEGYNHVLSSRIQTYVDPNDVTKLPELITINYENTPIYIYLSTDTLKFFHCQIEGHIAKHCPNLIQQTVNNIPKIPDDKPDQEVNNLVLESNTHSGQITTAQPSLEINSSESPKSDFVSPLPVSETRRKRAYPALCPLLVHRMIQ